MAPPSHERVARLARGALTKEPTDLELDVSPGLPFRSGFVAVVGRPNVGKSTLVNALVGIKVAITSGVPQTTRGAIRAVLNREGVQVVLIDTPGYHKPRTLLGERLNDVVRAAWSDVDLALFVVDGRAGVGSGDERVAQDLAAAARPVFYVVNKVDSMRAVAVAHALEAGSRLGDFEEYVPISARSGEGVTLLEDLVVGRMPQGPMYYPAGASTDQPPPVFVAELVREKLLRRTREELPHSIAVVTDEYAERPDGLLAIHADIYVERESQKGMVIGRGGALLKDVGQAARLEIETLFGRRVYLDLRVRVAKDWQRRPRSLERLGFGHGSAKH